MGVIKRGILGGFSGKVGGIVGGSWKGLAVIKTLPLSVANPKTAKQMTQRNKFSQCVKAASILLINVCKAFWDRTAQYKSGYNSFVQRNIDNFDADGVSNLAGLVMSPGKLPLTQPTISTMTAADTFVEIVWLDDSGEGEKLATDLATFALYHEDGNKWYDLQDSKSRVNLKMQIDDLPALVQGDKYSAWLLFQSADGFISFMAGSDLSGTVQ